MATSAAAQVVNQALLMMGGNSPQVAGDVGNFTCTDAGIQNAANGLYTSCVQTVGRQFAWDFERTTVQLQATGNVPPSPQVYEFTYPANAVQVWQVMPTVLPDPNDPLPFNWVVANNVVGAARVKVIQTKFNPAQAVVSIIPAPTTWDALFREAVVRLLGSEFAIALGGKPTVEAALLESGASFESIGEARQD